MNTNYLNSACQSGHHPYPDYTTGRQMCVGCLAEWTGNAPR